MCYSLFDERPRHSLVTAFGIKRHTDHRRRHGFCADVDLDCGTRHRLGCRQVAGTDADAEHWTDGAAADRTERVSSVRHWVAGPRKRPARRGESDQLAGYTSG